MAWCLTATIHYLNLSSHYWSSVVFQNERHYEVDQMETFSALRALCGETRHRDSPHKGSVTRTFMFLASLNKRFTRLTDDSRRHDVIWRRRNGPSNLMNWELYLEITTTWANVLTPLLLTRALCSVERLDVTGVSDAQADDPLLFGEETVSTGDNF